MYHINLNVRGVFTYYFSRDIFTIKEAHYIYKRTKLALH